MRIGLFVFVLASVSALKVFGQERKVIDSLETLLVERPERNHYPVLHRLAVEYVDRDNQKALTITERAARTAWASGDSSHILKSQRLKGQVLIRLKKLEDAIKVLLPMTDFENYDGEKISVLNNLGIAYLYLGQFDNALAYYFRTVDLAKESQDSTNIAMGLQNIGITYYKLKDYSKALPFLLESYAIEKRMNSVAFDAPMNISLCFANLKDYSNARKYLEESEELCGSDCSPFGLIHINYAMGCILFGEGDAESAYSEFISSLEIARHQNDYRMQLDNIYFLAEIYINRRQFAKAENILAEGDNIIQKGIPFNMEKIKVYSRLAGLYHQLMNFRRAADYQARYILLKDSIYNESLTTNLMRLESEYLERANTDKIAFQEEVIALKERVIEQQRWMNIVGVVFGLTLFIFSVFLFERYSAKKNLSILLDKKVSERTVELEVFRDSLLRDVQERDLLIRRVSSFFLSTIQSITGLCSAADSDTLDSETKRYFHRIMKAAKDFSNSYQLLLQRTQGKSDA